MAVLTTTTSLSGSITAGLPDGAISDSNGEIISATAATLAITKTLHNGRIVNLNKITGIAVTLPVSTGDGSWFRFYIGATITSVGTTIKVADAATIMQGRCVQLADGGDTVNGYETASDTDTITLDGTTKGGLVGDFIELIDVATGVWYVRILEAATGSEATPFSATVS